MTASGVGLPVAADTLTEVDRGAIARELTDLLGITVRPSGDGWELDGGETVSWWKDLDPSARRQILASYRREEGTADEAAALRDAGSAAEQDEAIRPIRDRLVADPLEEAADHPTVTFWDETVGRVAPATSATDLRDLAAEYREGRR